MKIPHYVSMMLIKTAYVVKRNNNKKTLFSSKVICWFSLRSAKKHTHFT